MDSNSNSYSSREKQGQLKDQSDFTMAGFLFLILYICMYIWHSPWSIAHVSASVRRHAFGALLNLCIGTLVAVTIAYRAAQIDCHVAGVVAIAVGFNIHYSRGLCKIC